MAIGFAIVAFGDRFIVNFGVFWSLLSTMSKFKKSLDTFAVLLQGWHRGNVCHINHLNFLWNTEKGRSVWPIKLQRCSRLSCLQSYVIFYAYTNRSTTWIQLNNLIRTQVKFWNSSFIHKAQNKRAHCTSQPSHSLPKKVVVSTISRRAFHFRKTFSPFCHNFATTSTNSVAKW